MNTEIVERQKKWQTPNALSVKYPSAMMSDFMTTGIRRFAMRCASRYKLRNGKDEMKTINREIPWQGGAKSMDKIFELVNTTNQSRVHNGEDFYARGTLLFIGARYRVPCQWVQITILIDTVPQSEVYPIYAYSDFALFFNEHSRKGKSQ